ncbi:unnamed protein product [Mytilus coruscus]|uniref:Uncharacterized protein n=1 Tax=Mytilus coruscus TaxID=42192 RepID=A0A6J8E5D2_MYTCO|nr:unnamed protein product [Mytilus coruscus]
MCHSLSNTDMQYELTPIVIRKASVLAPSTSPQPTDDTNKINQNNPSPKCFEPTDIEHVADDNPLPDSDISVDGGGTDSNVQQNFDAIDVGNSDPLLLKDDQKHMLISKNASHTSKTSQNELLSCIKRFIQETIVHEGKAQPLGPHLGYQCDEVSDACNWEQLGIVIRYLRDGSPVEKLLEFVQAEETTGSALCGLIVKALTDAGLDIQFCHAQTMDGAGNMSGKNLGCVAQFTRLSPRTVYHFCASHNLNLVLCKCCNVPEIQLMLDSLKQLGIFFKYSPKRSRCLEKAVDEINSNRDAQNKITFNRNLRSSVK